MWWAYCGDKERRFQAKVEGLLSRKCLPCFGVRRTEAESIEGAGEGRSSFALFLLVLSFASVFEASSFPSLKEKGRYSSVAIALYEHRRSSLASRYYCCHRGGTTAPSLEALLLPPSTCYFPSGIRTRSASLKKITSLRGHDPRRLVCGGIEWASAYSSGKRSERMASVAPRSSAK